MIRGGKMMKNPLHYQLSEYDCGPTAMLNAISFLFEREKISPVIIRNIMLYCLDSYNGEGIMGKSGTSSAAMMFLSNWLNGFGKIGQLPVSAKYLSGKEVYLGGESRISDALRRGGAVVLRVLYECGHYVLLTGEKDGSVFLFDSYYDEKAFDGTEIAVIRDHPSSYNRIAPESCFNRESLELYALGPVDDREAVILYNEDTKLTQEQTIEYFI